MVARNAIRVTLAAACVAASPPVAHADDDTDTRAQRRARGDAAGRSDAIERSATQPGSDAYRGAPRPHEASGVLVDRDDDAQPLLWIPRIVLAVPRYALEVPFAPVRLGLYAYERYDVKDIFRDVFFNEDGTFGVYPTADVETGFGASVGARMLYRDAFRSGGELSVGAKYGGRYDQKYEAEVETGELLGDHVRLELAGEYETIPRSKFFGIGNGDLVPVEAIDETMIDPRANPAAVESRFRYDDVRSELGLRTAITDSVAVTVSGAVERRTFDTLDADSSYTDIGAVYDTMAITGFREDIVNGYAELELEYDGRERNRFYLSEATPSTGWKLTGFAGRQHDLLEDLPPHWRYGVDVQRYFDLYGGDRVLALRLYGEGVSGDLDEVPFDDLPRLGGPVFLRGYDRDRFRDLYAAMGSAEYMYPIMRYVSGYVFVDAGRVYRQLDDANLRDLRVGYGGGLQAHTRGSFLARAFVASSIDGGLFFNLSFDPAFDTRSRREKP